MQKRALTKKKSPGKWDMPSAGHIDAGESPIDGCIRETKEELGLDTKARDYVFLKELINEKGHELAQIYLLKTDSKIEEMKLQKEEVEQVMWLCYEDFVKLLYSDEFCGHAKEYKDWVAEILKKV